MKSIQTDADWEYFGKNDPYFGVLTQEEYKQGNLSTESREKFFESGENHIHFALAYVRQYIQPAFKPENLNALDFGCGVGRLVLPLAQQFRSVTGVDVSPSMLQEARKNCQERGLTNVEFTQSLEHLSAAYDFIHSFIVFQHIPPAHGEALFKRLVGLLRDDGVGVIHLTYHREMSVLMRVRYWLNQVFPSPIWGGLANLIKGRPFGQPIMQMNEYDLNRIFQWLQAENCHHCLLRFTQHGETSGVILFFEKKSLVSP